MTCTATLFGGPLACTLTAAHDHHVYAATEPGDTHYEPTEGDH